MWSSFEKIIALETTGQVIVNDHENIQQLRKSLNKLRGIAFDLVCWINRIASF